jgi:hypothetical protein
MLEELLPTEELEIGILDPALTQRAPAAASLTLPKSSRGQGITASDSKETQNQFARKSQGRRRIPAKTIT